MRHGLRLDDYDFDASGGPALWPDRSQRPYDTPICDVELPRTRFAELRAALAAGGRAPITAIFSSPFRRCLQTAGICALEARVSRVSVDAQFSESMHAVRRICKKAAMSTPPERLVVLDALERAEAVGAGVVVEDAPSAAACVVPPWIERPEDAAARFSAAILAARAAVRRDDACGSVLVVSHGDALSAAAALAKCIVYSTPECSWVEIDVGTDDAGAESVALVGMGGGVAVMDS